MQLIVVSLLQPVALEPAAKDIRTTGQLNNLGLRLQEQGRYLAATAAFEEVTRRKPSGAKAYSNLGYVATSLGDFGRAEKHLRTALTLEPTLAATYVNLANVLQQLAREDEAMSLLGDALRIRPQHVGTHSALAGLAEKTERTTLAVATRHRAARLQPQNAAMHAFLGDALRQAGRNVEALTAYDRALELRPALEGDTKLREDRGSALQQTGRHDEAIRLYERGLTLVVGTSGSAQQCVGGVCGNADLELSRAYRALGAALYRSLSDLGAGQLKRATEAHETASAVSSAAVAAAELATAEPKLPMTEVVVGWGGSGEDDGVVSAVDPSSRHEEAYALLTGAVTALADAKQPCGLWWGNATTVEEVTTGVSKLSIVENACADRALTLGGGDGSHGSIIQSHTADEFIYHEAMVHPALVAFKAINGRPPRNVFLGGSGEGAGAREILRWGSVTSLTMVELDTEVTRLAQEWFAGWGIGAALEDPRLTLITGDVVDYLANLPDGSPKYDVAILDFPDMIDPAFAHLYSQELYRLVQRHLVPGGVLLTQSGPVAIQWGSTVEYQPAFLGATLESLETAGFLTDSLVHPMATWTHSAPKQPASSAASRASNTSLDVSHSWFGCMAIGIHAPMPADDEWLVARPEAGPLAWWTLSSRVVDAWIREEVGEGALGFYSGAVHRAMLEKTPRWHAAVEPPPNRGADAFPPHVLDALPNCSTMEFGWSDTEVFDLCEAAREAGMLHERTYTLDVPYEVCNRSGYGRGICVTQTLPKGAHVYHELMGELRTIEPGTCEANRAVGIGVLVRSAADMRRFLAAMSPKQQCDVVNWMWSSADFQKDYGIGAMSAPISVHGLVNHANEPSVRCGGGRGRGGRVDARASSIELEHCNAMRDLLPGEMITENYCQDYDADDARWLQALKRRMDVGQTRLC